MVALNWDQVGERFYETGVDRGVFYPKTGTAEVWNGLVSVDESPTGGDSTPIHLDGRKVYDLYGSEDFEATIEAYSAPEGFKSCDGRVSVAPGLFATQQPRQRFDFSYRTRIGNDLLRDDYGYKIHLVYNASAAPSAKSNKTATESTNVDTLKWVISTVPPFALTYKPTSHLIIDSTKLTATKLTAVEDLLYGTASTSPSLPTQASLISLLTAP